MVAYSLIANYGKIPLISNKFIKSALILAIIIKIAATYPAIIGIGPNFLLILLLVFFVSLAIFLCYRYQLYIRRFSAIFLFLFAAVVILSIREIHASDFNFFIGPALKLHLGEPLGSLYVQYGVLEIYIFKFMIDFGLKLHHMQLALAGIFVLFFTLYCKAASNLIKDRFLVYLFMINLILFRFLALKFHAISSPQANPIRLDLWLPLFLITSKFGFFSPISSTAFAIAYIADDLFGLFALIIYLAAIAALTLKTILIKETTNFKNLFVLFTPIASAVLIHFYLFKSISPPSAKLINELQYWRLVISPYSMFWPFLIIFPLFLYLTLTKKNQFQKQLFVFLLGLAFVELIYFFGRSHENNLLATSGILLLIVYLALDRIKEFYKNKWGVYAAPTFLILVTTIFFSSNIILNLKTAFDHLRSGQIITTNQIDRDIDNNPNLLESFQTKKIYLMGFNDAYINYRYGLKQVGYYSPFVANLFKSDTVNMLKTLSDKNYVLLYEQGSWFNIEEYNGYLKNSNIEFESKVYKPLGQLQFYELNVVEKR